MGDTMTNREFAEKDQAFKLCCEKAKVKPTQRQASKFRNKKGAAYQTLRSKKED